MKYYTYYNIYDRTLTAHETETAAIAANQSNKAELLKQGWSEQKWIDDGGDVLSRDEIIIAICNRYNTHEYDFQSGVLLHTSETSETPAETDIYGTGFYPFDQMSDQLLSDIYSGNIAPNTEHFGLDDTELVLDYIVNPENEQRLIGPVFVCKEAWREDFIQRELYTETTKYHDWRSVLNKVLEAWEALYKDKNNPPEEKDLDEEWTWHTEDLGLDNEALKTAKEHALSLFKKGK